MKLNLILIAAISSAVSATRYGLLRVSNAEGGHTNKSAARRALSFDEDFRVSFRELFDQDYSFSMSMSMSMPASFPVAAPVTPMTSDVPSQSPSMSVTSVATESPTVGGTLPAVSDDTTPAPTLIDGASSTGGPTSEEETLDEIQSGEIQTAGATGSASGITTLTAALVGVSAVALVGVVAALLVRKKAKNNAAASKATLLGAASTSASGGGSVSDISTDAPPSAAGLAEI